MICPNCSFTNKQGAGFCGGCGEKLLVQNTAQTPTSASSAAAVQMQRRARPFCGKCGSELRADGSCLRCSVPRMARNLSPTGAPLSTGVEMPKIPTRTVLLVLGTLCTVASAIFAGKALWGDSLLVRANVPGATVFVDGEEKGHTAVDGATPLSVAHLHGKLHTIVVKAEGYRDATSDVTFPNQMTRPLTLYLAPKPAGLHLQGLAGSAVFLNNRFAGRMDTDGSWSAPNLPPNDYLVTVRQQGYVEWTHNATLKAGDQQSLAATQPEVPLTPEQKQAKALALFSSANQKFLAGQYPAALAECDASVERGAGNEASALCDHIRDTMSIVNGGAK
jgi:hypothetical protein